MSFVLHFHGDQGTQESLNKKAIQRRKKNKNESIMKYSNLTVTSKIIVLANDIICNKCFNYLSPKELWFTEM